MSFAELHEAELEALAELESGPAAEDQEREEAPSPNSASGIHQFSSDAGYVLLEESKPKPKRSRGRSGRKGGIGTGKPAFANSEVEQGIQSLMEAMEQVHSTSGSVDAASAQRYGVAMCQVFSPKKAHPLTPSSLPWLPFSCVDDWL